MKLKSNGIGIIIILFHPIKILVND